MRPDEERTSLAAKKAALDRAGQGCTAIRCPQFITWVGKHPENVYCKSCGAVLIAEGQRQRAYSEIKLFFDDGSAHVTALCRNCVSVGFTIDTLEALYCADLVALATEEDLHGILQRWEMMATRKPIGFVKEL